MYRSHFHFTSRPFAETVDPSAYIPLAGCDATLHRLRYGLESGPGAVAAIGPPGVGKTLLARRLSRDLGGPTIHVPFPAISSDELLTFVADELDAPRGVGGAMARVRSAFTTSALRGVRPTLIIDDAHLVRDPSTFESLRLLLNFASRGTPDLGLVLVGESDFLDRLPDSLTERLAGRFKVEPFTATESSLFVRGRLAKAGGSDSLFDTEALRVLHCESDGLPRRINRLADLALLIAFARALNAPDVECVRLAASEAAFVRAA